MIGDALVYAGCSGRVTVGLCFWKFRGTRIVFHPFVRHHRAFAAGNAGEGEGLSRPVKDWL